MSGMVLEKWSFRKGCSEDETGGFRGMLGQLHRATGAMSTFLIRFKFEYLRAESSVKCHLIHCEMKMFTQRS